MVKKKNAELTASRRRQLLDAAEECFAQHGFHATSMSQISKASEMSIGNIYGYFANKADIINALVQSKLDDLCTVLDGAGDFASLADFLCELLRRQMLVSYDRNQDLLTFDVMAELDRNAVVTDVMRGQDSLFRERLGRICHSFKPDWSDEIVASRVELFMLLLDGFPMRTSLHPELDREAFVREAEKVITHMCGD